MAILQVNFLSKKLFRTVPMYVVLPVERDGGLEADGSLKKYKTLYLLHGLLGNYTDWLHGTRIQRWAEEKNLAVVMPSGDNSFYIDNQLDDLYGEFIGEELVEITRRMFPLSCKREDTFIGGLSMGGYGAIRNGLKYHETFGAVIGLSSALYIFEETEKTKNRNADLLKSYFGDLSAAAVSDKNPKILLENMKKEQLEGKDVKMPQIFMACGIEDALIDVNRLYRDYFLENGMDIKYIEGPGNHDWDFWDTYIKRALDWLPIGQS